MLTNEDKVSVIQDLFIKAYNYFDSFETNHVGSHLFYLVGAITDFDKIDLAPDSPIHNFIMKHYKSDHPIMQFIDLVEEE